MTFPLLTIVTVTKNCNATLERTLKSVSAVKTADVEYVVVDGASTDGTVELIINSGNLVDRFISEPDSGIYNAMNKGIDLATGKYILFINGDDELVPEGFPIVLPLLKDGQKDVIAAKTLVVESESLHVNLIANPWQLYFFNTIPHPSTFVLTDILRKYRFREDLKIASDYDLFLRLYLDSYQFVKVNATTALHHRGGASANSELSILEMDQIRLNRLGSLRYRLLNFLWKIYRIFKLSFRSLQR